MNLYIPFTAILALMLSGVTLLQAQIPLDIHRDIEEVHVHVHWGEIHIHGITGTNSHMKVSYTDASNQTLEVPEVAIDEYISIKKEGERQLIFARRPQGFESIDIDVYVPQHLFVQAQVIRGGNIYVENIQNGMEIDSRNGSVKAIGIGSYALVNAANGEVQVEFASVDPRKPVSLITMNGGIQLSLPAQCKRDLRLISRKNGHVKSDFEIGLKKKGIPDTGYSKEAIRFSSEINGGGALLFLSTENGPVHIKKQ